MVEQPPTLSVVLISWNQLPQLKVLLNQLLHQDFPRDRYEIIVVDDGSTDGTQEWLSAVDSAGLRKVLLSVNIGRSRARNRGLSICQNDIIVMIDGDHSVQRTFLAIHAARHANSRCVIAGTSKFVDHKDYRALHHYLNNGGGEKLPVGTKLPGRYFRSGNCSLPRFLLNEIGLFDERISAWGGEDLELGKRIEKSGVPIYSEPRALAIHHHLRPLPDLLQQLYAYGKNAVPLLVERHPELFMELNLDHVAVSGADTGRFGAWHRRLFRLLLSAPLYMCARSIAQMLQRFHLPRLLFDYLHFRQYVCGYLSSIREK